jgi:hypothetical protein
MISPEISEGGHGEGSFLVGDIDDDDHWMRASLQVRPAQREGR